jgi:hypothetical protein
MKEEVEMKSNSLTRQHAWLVVVCAWLIFFSSSLTLRATADVRPLPDPGITRQTRFVIPYKATYRVEGLTQGTSVISNARAPFASGPQTVDGRLSECRLQFEDIGTLWPINTALTLRTSFDLPTGASNLRVLVSVDNDV